MDEKKQTLIRRRFSIFICAIGHMACKLLGEWRGMVVEKILVVI